MKIKQPEKKIQCSIKKINKKGKFEKIFCNSKDKLQTNYFMLL